MSGDTCQRLEMFYNLQPNSKPTSLRQIVHENLSENRQKKTNKKYLVLQTNLLFLPFSFSIMVVSTLDFRCPQTFTKYLHVPIDSIINVNLRKCSFLFSFVLYFPGFGKGSRTHILDQIKNPGHIQTAS